MKTTAHASTPAPSPGAAGAAQDILRVERLKKYFKIGGGLFGGHGLTIRAVDDVSFSVRAGETFGLVGESGCGKTTLGQTIIRLYDPTAGNIWFNGANISHLSAGQMRTYRRDIQMIFQDPSASLDPRMTVGGIISEPLNIFGVGTRAERRERVQELLRVVGLNAYFANRYPHEFSGGQRQRIGIARALALRPKMIVADEPVSALDVSIQAQVVNLLDDLQDELGLTYVIIAHDLSVVRHVSDRVAVMYLGKIVELGPRDDLYGAPMHPYTVALLSAVPVPDVRRKQQRERILLSGDVPSPINPPPACRFHTRCWKAQEICRTEEPPLRELRTGHVVACHFPENAPPDADAV